MNISTTSIIQSILRDCSDENYKFWIREIYIAGNHEIEFNIMDEKRLKLLFCQKFDTAENLLKKIITNGAISLIK